MLIYSSASETFIKKVKAMAREIFCHEININFDKKRILINRIYYPLHFVCFEHPSTLGFYDPKIYQIGINKNLMFKFSNDIIKNILRHEIAHFLCHVFDGDDVKTHGPEFRAKFLRYNWDANFSKSKILIEDINPSLESDKKILEKVDKLLKLATSSNVNEASLATQMANQLITKHNLEYKNSLHAQEDTETCVIRASEFSKKNALHDGLYQVLGNFNVYPVFNQGRSGGYLEVIGTRVNVTIAKYITDHLSASLELIWNDAKKKNPLELKGIVAKNNFTRSFFITLDQKLKIQTSHEVSKTEALTLSNQLSLHVTKVYPRLRSSYTREHGQNEAAKKLGVSAARNFEIKPGLSQSSRSKGILSYFKN